MNHDQQSALVSAMGQSGFYPHPVGRVQMRETHISRVFLAGAYVYKIKKPVNLGFLDYESLKKRRRFCEREVVLNRRLADSVYLGVVPITRDRNRFHLAGNGQTVEYAVKMRRLPEDRSLRHLLRTKAVGPDLIQALARRLCEYYGRADAGPSIDIYGSMETIRANCEENFHQINQYAGHLLDAHLFQVVESASRAFLDRNGALFAERVQAGRIRDCHGDLRCGHVYDDRGLQIIDCIEFNAQFRYSDIASDLAFLAMDMEYENCPELACTFVAQCVDILEDNEIYGVIDFYKCYRAVVRSKVLCISIKGAACSDYVGKRLQREANRYLFLAYVYAVRFTRPTLWVMCGLPASGKSTVADHLSRVLRIPVLRSDEIRRTLFPTPPEGAPFGKGIYAPEAVALTYGRMLLSAQEHVGKGLSVILDATFALTRQRREVIQLARDTNATIVIVACTAPARCIQARLGQRGGDPSISDARRIHFKDFVHRFEPLNDVSESVYLSIDTTAPPDTNIRRILARADAIRFSARLR